MGNDSATLRVTRPFGRRTFWVLATVTVGILLLIAVNVTPPRAQPRWNIPRDLPQGSGVKFEAGHPAKLLLRFDYYRFDEYSKGLPQSLALLEKLDTLREFEIRSAYIPKSQLSRIPTPPSVCKLRMANYLEVCSETCVIDAANTSPFKPEFAWNGQDMAFLSRFKDLKELDLKSLWLRTGVLEVIGALPQLEVLTIDRCDFPGDELPSLTALKNLRVLTFWYTPKAMRDLTCLAQLETLQELSLIGCRIEGKMLKPLAMLPHLHTLRLDYGRLEDNDLSALEAFPKLRVLTLKGISHDSGGLKCPAALKHLEWLDLRSENRRDREALLTLVETVPASCKVLIDHAEWSNRLPPDAASRLTDQPRKELEYLVEY